MRWILLVSTAAVVYCRPQYYEGLPSAPPLKSPGDSSIDYSTDDDGDATTPKVTIIPFYGGGKGQALQIIEKPDGTVTTTIIQTPPNGFVSTTESVEESIDTTDLEYPPLPTKQDQQHAYGENIKNIHQTALNIIKLQEVAKKNGKLSANEELVYKENMDALNSSAQKLAKFQEEESDHDFENREGLSEWFELKKSTKKDKDKKKEEDRKRKEEEERKKSEQEEEKRKKEEEEKKKQEEEEEVGENEEEGIAVELPSAEASVAEAKPVGLAVAGEGGVAASKPIATAVVGPGGLAIARPVGTAIAGVSPDQALVPIYAEGYIASTKPKRRGGSTAKSDSASEYLNKIISKYHQN